MSESYTDINIFSERLIALKEESELKLKLVYAEIDKQKELNTQEAKFLRDELIKQALEYERRLGILNHEARQLKNMQDTYLLSTTYEEFRKGLDAVQQIMDDKIAQQITWQATTKAELAVLMEFKKTTEQSIKDIKEKDIAPIKAWKSSLDGKWALIAFLITIAMFINSQIKK
jgi:hypothetical protein